MRDFQSDWRCALAGGGLILVALWTTIIRIRPALAAAEPGRLQPVSTDAGLDPDMRRPVGEALLAAGC